jgi:acetyltransferase-like isoleucine patch superfamily enzyme
MKDKVFFIVQGFLKYNAFDFGMTLRRFFYKPFFKSFGKNIKIRDGVTIKYPSEIEFGNDVKIEPYCFFVGKGGLKLGNNVLVGAGTKIITSSHNFEDPTQSIREQGLSFTPVEIGDDVWFGFDVKVLGGSVVKKGSIVGTNSLINSKTFEPFSIIAGTPAKLIKYRDSSEN